MHRYRFRLQSSLSLGFALALSACAGQPVTLDKVYQSGQCAEQTQALRLLTSREELQTLVRQPLGGGAQLPDVDLNDHWLVLATWGGRPNAGYRVTLVSDRAHPDGDVLELPIAFEAPEPGTMQAQVMTSPCLVIAVPKGAYTQLQVEGMDMSLSLQE